MKIFARNTVISFMIMLFFVVSSESYATSKKIVRVACILDHGFYIMEENGGLSGYNFDYLMMMAQHTGWDYDFVMIDEGDFVDSQEKAFEMLENGEIDLIGTVYKSDALEEELLFANTHTGITRYMLASFASNYKVTQDNYFLQDILKIALVEGEEVNDIYYTLLELRGLNYEITHVDTEEEALQLLLEEKVDTILTTDMSENSWLLKHLTVVERLPFYFVTSKNNQELMSELDSAMENISIEEPEVHQRLLSEYFGILESGNIILTSEEEEALADYPFLTVGLLKGREPYQFYNENNVENGISVEILECISEIIGIDFQYVWLDSRQDVKEKVANQEIDIFATAPYDTNYEMTYFFDVVVTQPYLTNGVVWLHQDNEKPNAVPHYYFITENIPFFPDEELVEISNFEEALLELSKNGAISIFADPYMAQYYMQKLGITNVEMQTVSAVQSKICFGVGKHLDSAVVGLLNNSLLHLDTFIVDEIIYDNVTVQNVMTIENFLKQHRAEILTVISAFLLSIILGLVYHGKKLKQITKEDSLTKLYNAGFFHQYVEERTRKVSQGCLILIDIDFFKQINDTHGHQQGDTIIKKVAENLRQQFRINDTVARLGGDEFIIFLEYLPTVTDLEQRCGKILSILADPDCEVPVTLSIGGYIFTEQTDYKQLYQLADSVLYEVKENGRNGYSFSGSVKSEFNNIKK